MVNNKIFFVLVLLLISTISVSQVNLGNTPCSAPNATFITGQCNSVNQVKFRSNDIAANFQLYDQQHNNCYENETNQDGWIKFIAPSDLLAIRLYDKGPNHTYYLFHETTIGDCSINTEPDLEFLFCVGGSPHNFEFITMPANTGDTYYLKIKKLSSSSQNRFDFDACFLNWGKTSTCGSETNPICKIDGPFPDFETAIDYGGISSCSQLNPTICNQFCGGISGISVYEECSTITTNNIGTLGVTGYFIANTSCAQDNPGLLTNIRQSWEIVLYEGLDFNNPIYSNITAENNLGIGWEWNNLNPNTTYVVCSYATIASVSCTMFGTCKRYYYPEPDFDCPSLMFNIGDACNDGDPNTSNDIVNANCICEGQLDFDCPSLMLNIGDPCDDGDLNTSNDTVNANCICEGQLDFDCPSIMLNICDACDDGDPNTSNDTVNANCICEGQLDFDCSSLVLNIGDVCNDGDPNTSNDTVNANCICEGQLDFDCLSLMLNIGDACDDGDLNTSNDTVNANCICEESNEQDIKYFIPNIISVNSVTNSCFKVYFGQSKPIEFEILIFDRWGNLIFKSLNIEECWEGYYNNDLVVSGVYVYVAQINDLRISGDLTVIK